MKKWKELDVLDEYGIHRNAVLLNLNKECSITDRRKLEEGKAVEKNGKMYSISKIAV